MRMMIPLAMTALTGVLLCPPAALGEPRPVAPSRTNELVTPSDPTVKPIAPPPMILTSEPLNFGYVAPKAVVDRIATLQNTGDKPLKLTRAVGDCECTKVSLSTNEVAPGETVDVLVTVEVPSEIRVMNRVVQVWAEGYDDPVFLRMEMEVGHAVRINGGSRYAVLVDRIGQFRLDAVDKVPFRVKSVNGFEPTFIGHDPATAPAQMEYFISYDWSEVPDENLPRWLVIETDHPEAPIISCPSMIPGYHRILNAQTKWRVQGDHVLVPSARAGQPFTATVRLTGRALKQGELIAAQSSNPDLKVRITGLRIPEAGGGVYLDFTVTPAPEVTGFVTSMITFATGGDEAKFDLYARLDPPQPGTP